MRTKKLIISFPKIPRKRFIKLISKARGLKLSNREIYYLFTFADRFQEKFQAFCDAFRNLPSAIMAAKNAVDNFSLVAGGLAEEYKIPYGYVRNPELPPFPMNGVCS